MFAPPKHRPVMQSGGWDNTYNTTQSVWGVEIGHELKSFELRQQEHEKLERFNHSQQREVIDRRHVHNAPSAIRSSRQTLFPGFMQPSTVPGKSPINTIPNQKQMHDMDIESRLRNMHVKLQRDDSNQYIPSSTGDLYHTFAVSTDRIERFAGPMTTHERLFRQDNTVPGNQVPSASNTDYITSLSEKSSKGEMPLFFSDSRQMRRKQYRQ